MGFLSRGVSAEERMEKLEMESECLSHERDVAEKRAIIRQLKAQHGPRWKQLLGVKSLDIATLRSFLVSANGGLRREQGKVGDIHMRGEAPHRGLTLKEAVVPRTNAPSPLPGGHLRKL